MFKEMFLVMCLVALSGFVIAQPIDDLELAAVGEKVENTQKLSDVADDSEDLVGAEHRWGGHRGYGGYGGGYGGYGGGYGGRRGFGGGYGGFGGGYGGFGGGYGGYGGYYGR